MRLLGAELSGISGGIGPGFSAATDLCGVAIGANRKLDRDLTCAGNGLTIGADRISIELNGHTIAGSGSGIGISVYTIAMNTCGIKGPVGDNTFKKNHFNGNGADSGP